MKFISTPPTEPGAYWWKPHETHPATLCNITRLENLNSSGGLYSSRLVPLDEYVEKGGVEKAFREGVHEEHENWFHRKNVPVNVMWRGSRAKALLDGKERVE